MTELPLPDDLLPPPDDASTRLAEVLRSEDELSFRIDAH